MKELVRVVQGGRCCTEHGVRENKITILRKTEKAMRGVKLKKKYLRNYGFARFGRHFGKTSREE